MKRWLFAFLALLLKACGKPGNSLLSASDAQFARLIKAENASSPSWAAAAVGEQHKADRVAELQKRAVEAGLRGHVTRERLADDRVRQRYFGVRKG